MAADLQPLINTQPGQKSRLWTALEGSLRQFALKFDHVLPAQVISYDRAKNVVQVQPMIQIVKLDGTPISRHPLANVPAVSMGGGGFHVSFPLKKGDFGWILATDRDYTIFMQTLQESMPNSTRAHKFEDALFLPDVLRQYTINSADETAMVIQATDSSTRIAIDIGGHIRITAPTDILIDTPLATFTGNVVIQQNLTVDQTATVDQTLTVTGLSSLNGGMNVSGGSGASITGPTNITGTLTNNGINVTTHGHVSSSPGVRTGNMEA